MRKVQLIKWIDTAAEMLAPMNTEQTGGCIFGETLGFFVREDKECVVLAMEQFEDGRWRHLVAIPKVAIKKRRTIWKEK